MATGGVDAHQRAARRTNSGARLVALAASEQTARRVSPTIYAHLPPIGKRQHSSLRTRLPRSYNTGVGEVVLTRETSANPRAHMDKFEEIGQRLDQEIARLRRYVEEEVAPGTERRTARFLREVSDLLTDAARKLEARTANRDTPETKDAHS
jgi:hypothetical protein